MISGFKHYFPQVPNESAAKSKNKPVYPTIKLSNWNVNVWTWEVLEYSLSLQNCLRNVLHPYYVYSQLDWRIGVRAGGGGARGAVAPPNFGQQEKIGQSQLLKTFSCFFISILRRYIFSILTWSRRKNQVTFTRDSGCQARDEFLFIREGFFYLWALYCMGYFQSWIH